jgi:pyridoxal phosphate enzyme (YggS family)
MRPSELSDRLGAVRHRIEAAGGDPAAITIVAVTKGFGPDMVREAQRVGLGDVGENYAQELLAKVAVEVGRWHFLGPIQRNKVKALAPHVHLWQGLDRAAAAAAVARHSPGAHVLVQVNVSAEPTKAGCRWDEVDAVVAGAAEQGLDVRGLMAIGPAGPPEHARPAFRQLRQTADRLGLPECSMGMSADLEVAVSEGATIVRVGTALFGPRSAPAEMRR